MTLYHQFYVDNTWCICSGVIEVFGATTNQPLDFETEPQYIFLVVATDGDSRVSFRSNLEVKTAVVGIVSLF